MSTRLTKRAKDCGFELVLENRECGIRPTGISKAISIQASDLSSDY